MNPDGAPRRGTPGWQHSNTADNHIPNARGQSSSYSRFTAPPGLAPLNPSTSSTQVPFISPGTYTSGNSHSFPTEVTHHYSSGTGHSFSSGGSHSYTSGGHTYPNQPLTSTNLSNVSQLKCPNCYQMGSDIYYFQAKYLSMTDKYNAELQQHLMCGPKFLTYEAKLEEHKQCEPRIQILEKELNEERGSREKCKKLENELDVLRRKCRKYEEEMHELKNALLNNNIVIKKEPKNISMPNNIIIKQEPQNTSVTNDIIIKQEPQNTSVMNEIIIKQEPDAVGTVGEEERSFDPKFKHIFSTDRKSQNTRNETSQYHSNGGKQHSKFNRNYSRYGNEEVSQEVPKTVRTHVAVSEIEGDLFEMPADFALAHCVGSDFIMSSGVAIKFRKKFRSIAELLDQRKGRGEVAFIKDNTGRYVYYLVTKEFSTGKPVFDDFQKAVRELRMLCEQHDVKKLAIPKIGCGRDHLDWNQVRELLNFEFSSTSVQITVCFIHQEPLPDKRWNLVLVHAKHPLTELNPQQCAVLFFGSKDGQLTDSMQKLSEKFNFKSDYKSQPKTFGNLYHYQERGGNVNVFGLIVKEKQSDPFSFVKFNECLNPLRRAMKKLSLYYIGFEAFDDVHCPSVTRKIWTTLIDSFFTDNFEIHICWPNNIREKPWEERK